MHGKCHRRPCRRRRPRRHRRRRIIAARVTLLIKTENALAMGYVVNYTSHTCSGACLISS